jgi:hypothetical protein
VSGIENPCSDRNPVTSLLTYMGYLKNKRLTKNTDLYFNRKQSCNEYFDDLLAFLLKLLEIPHLSLFCHMISLKLTLRIQQQTTVVGYSTVGNTNYIRTQCVSLNINEFCGNNLCLFSQQNQLHTKTVRMKRCITGCRDNVVVIETATAWTTEKSEFKSR